jgi:hypothetical protein
MISGAVVYWELRFSRKEDVVMTLNRVDNFSGGERCVVTKVDCFSIMLAG